MGGVNAVVGSYGPDANAVLAARGLEVAFGLKKGSIVFAGVHRDENELAVVIDPKCAVFIALLCG